MEQQLVNDAVQWIKTLPAFSIYTVFFLVAYLENIIPPIPGDLLVAFGGYLAAISIVSFVPIYILTVVASVVGFMNVYWLGYHWGGQIEKKPDKFWLLRFIPLKYINKVSGWMGRWGMGVIVANRFLAGTRSVISLTAGISQTSIPRTIISSAISSLLWNAVLIYLGYIVQQNWQIIGRYLAVYGRIILGLLLLFIIIRLIIYFYKKKKNQS